MRVLAAEAPNLRECRISDDQQVQAAVDALLLSQRRRAALPLTAVKAFVRDRITPRARTGWRGLLRTLQP